MALEKEIGLPVVYENETLTSTEARSYRLAAREKTADAKQKKVAGKEKQARMKVDASAAALILQSYLDKNVIK